MTDAQMNAMAQALADTDRAARDIAVFVDDWINEAPSFAIPAELHELVEAYRHQAAQMSYWLHKEAVNITRICPTEDEAKVLTTALLAQETAEQPSWLHTISAEVDDAGNMALTVDGQPEQPRTADLEPHPIICAYGWECSEVAVMQAHDNAWYCAEHYQAVSWDASVLEAVSTTRTAPAAYEEQARALIYRWKEGLLSDAEYQRAAQELIDEYTMPTPVALELATITTDATFQYLVAHEPAIAELFTPEED
jgi:hypothetical protein